jgi:hypothetical protein
MLTSKKIKKIIFLGVFFVALFISIFSFTLIPKVQAQCAPGTVLYNNACISTYLYNQISQSSNSSTTLTNQNTPFNESTYEPLAKLPDLGNFKFDDPCPLGRYLNIVINLIIGLIAVMAMVTIVMGGLQYITSELVSGKADGKSKILNAIFGLLIALSSYLVLNTLNPNLLNLCLDGIPKAQITIEDLQIQGRLGKGKCEPSSNTSSPCHPSKLSAFSNPTQASAICNGESGDGKFLSSALDKGSDGNSFSFGVFQINIIAHGDKIGNGTICKNIFKVDPNPPGKVGNSINDSSLGGCLERKNGICLKYAATVIDKSRYNACKNFISQTNENTKYAAQLQKKSGWGQWGFNKSCGF